MIGAWSNLPVPVVFDRDYYAADSGEIMTTMRAGLNTWNGWARHRGKVAFQVNLDGTAESLGMEIPAAAAAGCNQANYSAAVTDMVGIWKITSHGNARNAREACGRNPTNNQLLKLLPDGVQGQTDWVVSGGKITGASILLNFEGYNAPGKERLDVESLLLHELGHVLGLLHSCNADASDQTTSRACNGAPARYVNAVMFPFLGSGEERRELRQNEYDRINCLY